MMIPGRMNLPVFNDEERAEVGTLDKQVCKERAVERYWQNSHSETASKGRVPRPGYRNVSQPSRLNLWTDRVDTKQPENH